MSKPIKSDNANALAELKVKAENLRTAQENMKAANAYFRKNYSMQGYSDWSDEKAAKVDERIQQAYSHQKQPYPAYELQNNYQNLKEIERRITQLDSIINSPSKEYDTEKLGFAVDENKDIMRLQIFFPKIPSVEVREQLKMRGFKWAPSKDCWQRLLNQNARFSLDGFIRYMQRQQQSEIEMT